MTEYQEHQDHQELLRSACADAYHNAVACKFLSEGEGMMTLDKLCELQEELKAISESVNEAKAKARMLEIKLRQANDD